MNSVYHVPSPDRPPCPCVRNTGQVIIVSVSRIRSGLFRVFGAAWILSALQATAPLLLHIEKLYILLS